MSIFDDIKKVKENLKQYSTIEHSNANKFMCEHCGTLLPKDVARGERGHCPLCGETVLAFENDLSVDEKRYNCPRCGSSYKVENTSEECPICSTYMSVYTPSKITYNPKSKMIPTSSD